MRCRIARSCATCGAALLRTLAAGLALVAWLALAALCAAPAAAQGLESVLRPGDVIAGHAKWEDDCTACHVRFNRDAQNGRCMDCHKDVGADVRSRSGFHGRIAPQPCRACHTDHKGRQARIVELDTKAFDHRQSDYLLRGKHAGVACASCHVAGKKYRDAPQECQACHRKDDTHKGSLGPQCADCHTETGWKDTRFDHSTTRFALTGKHLDAECASCHKSKVYKDAPSDCVACHRKDDNGPRGHRGQFGERCDSCHGTKGWRPATFSHDRDTHFALRGGHRTAECSACHKAPLYRDKLATTCVSCHRADDPHKGSLGQECQACHVETRWTETARFDHARTRFALGGRHTDVKCAACHRGAPAAGYKVADTRCVACHRQDDAHKARLGERCESCHVDRGWKVVDRFDHATSRFPLRGGHAKAECKACHKTALFRDTPSECLACHRKDDRHEGQLGERCESCHRDTRWKDASFDHARARFPLVGRHVRVACDGCHQSLRHRDAPSECVACHRKDDRHEARLGTACENCHNARDWRLGQFDHARTAFALDGAHAKVRCETCHRAPAPAGKPIAPLADGCLACHRKDDRHDGGFGPRCEQCHVTDDWKRLRRRPGGLAPTSSVAPVKPATSALGDASWFARAATRRPS